jgi:protein-L-isoaspartate(D-aspartate) O-methyltransferase
VEEDKLDRRRRSQMLEFLQARYRHKIKDERVLKGMGTVPRHMYMLAEDRDRAYDQMWFKIGYGQTITDPGMVAYMTELIAVKPTDKVLEIGTGSGYQGSVLAQLTPNVFTIEIVEKLALRSHALLDKLGYGPEVIHRKIADGYFGWEEEAPFDKIIVTCAADHVPVPLLQQLKPGGLMVIPVGPRYQPGKLHFVAKDADGKVHTKVLSTVEFVPMTRLVKGKVR